MKVVLFRDFSVGSWLFLMVLSGCEVRIATEVGNSSDQLVDGQVSSV